MSILSRHWHVVAIDLPGQGFTQSGNRMRLGLEATADDLLTLMDTEEIKPVALIGHSAGAAIALRMALTRPGMAVIGINAALAEFPGIAGWLFPTMAKLLSWNPLTALTFSATSTISTVRRLISSTGSTLPNEAIAQLGMMAQWDLRPLRSDLVECDVPTLLIAAKGDKAVPAKTSAEMAKTLKSAQLIEVGGGHLVHEEKPEEIAELIEAFCRALKTP